jgi:hypothetical protein
MSEQAKFISGDGVEHEVSVDSPAFELMSKDGSFTRVYTEADAVAQLGGNDAETAGGRDGESHEADTATEGLGAPQTGGEALSDLSRAALVAKAKGLGVKASGKSPAIIAAIEAKQAELAGAEKDTK